MHIVEDSEADTGINLHVICIYAGNAPVMIHRSNLALIVEDWYDIALRMKSDEKANKAFGWILEMVRGCPQRSGARMQ